MGLKNSPLLDVSKIWSWTELISLTCCHIISLIIIKLIGYTGHAIAYVVTVLFYVFHCFVSVLSICFFCACLLSFFCKFKTFWLLGKIWQWTTCNSSKVIQWLRTWYCFFFSFFFLSLEWCFCIGVLIHSSCSLIKILFYFFNIIHGRFFLFVFKLTVRSWVISKMYKYSTQHKKDSRQVLIIKMSISYHILQYYHYVGSETGF